MQAYYYYVTHQSTANAWSAKEARIQFDPSLLDVAASFEPNMKARTIRNIDVKITENDVQSMQSGAKFGYDRKLTAIEPNMRDASEGDLLSKALQSVGESPLDFSNVELR